MRRHGSVSWCLIPLKPKSSTTITPKATVVLTQMARKPRLQMHGIKMCQTVLHHIPPLMGTNRIATTTRPNQGKACSYQSPAQIARWRGWSEVLFAGAYGTMLRAAELHLNNMISDGKPHPLWRQTNCTLAHCFCRSNKFWRVIWQSHDRQRFKENFSLLVSSACDGLQLYQEQW